MTETTSKIACVYAYCGDALQVLRTLQDNTVNCIVTSPPYYALRDYGHEGQIGLEQTPQEFIGKLVEVFRECRRVLTKDGTCWVNMGDSYASGGRTYRDADEKLHQRGMSVRPKDAQGIKPKDLLGIPWRLAFALQDDGWYLRQDIIWAKPNPMPESVRDRCTKAHEYVFLLTKSERYWYDADAVAEDAVGQTLHDLTGGRYDRPGQPAHSSSRKSSSRLVNGKRNRRSVWTINTKPCKLPHPAMMPLELAKLCVLAGCPSGGTVLDPFAGAGTSLLAAAVCGREGVGIEISRQYLDTARTRVSEHGHVLVERSWASAPGPV